jgi:hypothetical protein
MNRDEKINMIVNLESKSDQIILINQLINSAINPNPHPDLEREIDECLDKFDNLRNDYYLEDCKADIKAILARAVKMPSEEEIKCNYGKYVDEYNLTKHRFGGTNYDIPSHSSYEAGANYVINYMKEGGK